jgi:hypothetical protein
MFMSLLELRPEKNCSGEAQQQLKTTGRALSSEKAPYINKPVTV